MSPESNHDLSKEAITAAAQCFAEGYWILADPAVPVAEAARRAYTPTGPSLAELERRIVEWRAERGIGQPPEDPT